METRSWHRASALVAIAGLTLAACQANAPAASTAPSAAPSVAATSAAPKAQRGAGGDLKILYWQAVTTLNPHLASGTKDNDASRLIIEPLAAWGPDGKPIAVLAKEIPTLQNGGVSKDLKTVTWKLDPKIKWSDGTPLTSADVTFTWTYRCDKATGAFTAGPCDDVDSVKATDANTVVVTYKQPSANYWEVGTGTNEGILQQAQFKDCVGAKAKDCPANNKPIGTGPYKLTELKPNDVVTYAINENYRDPNKPFFKTVTIKGGGDAESAARAVCQTGEIDYGWNLQVPLNVLQPMISAADSKCVFPAAYNALERLTINFANPDPSLGDQRSEPSTKHPYMNDIHVRRALAMATNRQAVADQLYGKPGGEAYCNITVFPKSPNTASLDVCKYDLAAAEKELQDNGWVKGPDGIRAKGGVKLVMNYITTTNAVRQATQTILKNDWEKIGFKVTIGNAAGGTFFTNTAPEGYAKFFADIEEFASSQDPDPQGFLAQYICSQATGKANDWNGNDTGRFCSADYDKLVDTLKAETDPAKRDQAAIAANDYLVKNVVLISLVNRTAPTPNGVGKALKGVNQSVFESSLWDIANWTK
jgi:peptide/nickel transport system substrate-binding protein